MVHLDSMPVPPTPPAPPLPNTRHMSPKDWRLVEIKELYLTEFTD